MKRWILFVLSLRYCLEGSPLDFEMAKSRALEYSFNLKQKDKEIANSQLDYSSTYLWPNPTLSVSVEAGGNSKKENNQNGNDVTCQISQEVETGSKRRYRQNIAYQDIKRAEALRELEEIILLNNLKKAFLQAYYAQETLKLSQKCVGYCLKKKQSMEAQIQEGQVASLQINREKIALKLSELDLKQKEKALREAKRALALLWGCQDVDFDEIEYPFYELEALELDSALEVYCNHPEATIKAFEIEQARLQYGLELSERIPDLVVTGGCCSSFNRGGTSVILGVEMPLPVFNCNQYEIQKAQNEVCNLELAQSQAECQFIKAYRAKLDELTYTYHQIKEMQDTTLNLSEETYTLSKEGYLQGKLCQDDVLETLKSYLDLQQVYLDAWLKYHQAQADIDYFYSGLSP